MLRRYLAAASLCIAAVNLVACGAPADPCPTLVSENARIFANGPTCSSGGLSVTKSSLTLASCTTAMAKCTANDRSAINSYLSCASSVPACTAGSESKTINNLVSCAAAAYSGISSECQAAIQ